MSSINIPPAALEAGARALREEVRRALNVEEQDPPEGPSQALMDAYRAEARAAFEAMVTAWEGAMFGNFPEDDKVRVELILPLTEKQDDKA